MENNKLDQLFQDKLARHDVAVPPETWDRVSAKLTRQNNRPVWLSIAATAAVLAVASFLIVNYTGNQTPGSGTNTLAEGPTPLQPFLWDLEEMPKKVVTPPADQGDQEDKRAVPAKKNVQVETDKPGKTQEPIKQLIVVPEIEPMGREAVALTKDLKPTLDIIPETGREPSVQITYIAKSTPEKDEKSTIEKLWIKAKELNPGEMWASLRATKNDFISGKGN